MRQYLLKNLFLSSCLFFLMYACSPVTGYKLSGKIRMSNTELKPLIRQSASLLYKTKLDVYSKHYSGLLLVKQTDSLSTHLTFVSELGMKLVDFELKNNELKPLYVFEPLNRQDLIQLLSSDLELIFLQKAHNKVASVYRKNEQSIYVIKENKKTYYTRNADSTIQKIKVKGLLFTKLRVHYNQSSDRQLHHIELAHTGFLPLRITLTEISRQNQ